MPSYKAPLRDMRFLLNEVFDFPAYYRALANGSDATPDMVEAILDECARLCEEVFGGHGYIREHGMEQIVRDARIATLYEGTTGNPGTRPARPQGAADDPRQGRA